jgi:hypothetical protein
VPESTLLEILNPALTSRKDILKISGHSTKGDLKNSPSTLYIKMCTFKASVLESKLLEILNHVLTSRKHLLKNDCNSTKGDL